MLPHSSCSFVAEPDLVADFPGDQPLPDVKVVQQTHPYLRTDRERAVLEAIARETECHPHVVEDPVRCSEAFDRMETDVLHGMEDTQVHLLDALSAGVRDTTGWSLPYGIFRIQLYALIDALGVLLVEMHVDQVERVLAPLLISF